MSTNLYGQGQPGQLSNQYVSTYAARTGLTDHQTFTNQHFAVSSEKVCQVIDMLQTLGIPVYKFSTTINEVEVDHDHMSYNPRISVCHATVELTIPPDAVDPTYQYVSDAIAAKRQLDKEARLRRENPMLAEAYKEYEATLILLGE